MPVVVLAPVFGPPRHPRVAEVDGHALRPPLVGHELHRVVLHRAQVLLVLAEGGERGERPASSKRESVGLREACSCPSNPGTPKNGFATCWSQKRAAAAECHVALRLERRRRLVVAAEVPLDVVAPAAGVGHVERDPPRQLALDADRELVDVRHDEVRVRKARTPPEEGRAAQESCRAAAWMPFGHGFESA